MKEEEEARTLVCERKRVSECVYMYINDTMVLHMYVYDNVINVYTCSMKNYNNKNTLSPFLLINFFRE